MLPDLHCIIPHLAVWRCFPCISTLHKCSLKLCKWPCRAADQSLHICMCMLHPSAH